MNAPARAWPPFTVARVLVLAAFLICAIIAVLIVGPFGSFAVVPLLGWLAVALALYFASLLVP